eukprot:CAMPEP_0178416720 /NCGR_PEP_ID=MMETSP0689_2-20121128/24207_1 /TAXON_ID=160604 /ORGANISM="Amphidinium massartii, Strain CS-259" /LENGTH=234 /DNA_ID=CAMNT_0020038069 /DNA_START=91 /DNA_END=795 /DNA_ORIENTATION=+
MVHPMTQFCCGCSLSFGTKVILFLNLVTNVFYIITAVSNVILQIPTIGYTASLPTQTFFASFCLLGLPFIVGGFYGAWHNMESYLRLYLYYMVVSFILDMSYILAVFLLVDVCHGMPVILEKHGAAFACGFMRIFSFCFTIYLVILQVYFIFTVWSLCEDLKVHGSSGGFHDLLEGTKEASSKRRYRAAYSDTLFAGGPVQTGFPVTYGAFASPGMGGSTRIYGKFHETGYPPP